MHLSALQDRQRMVCEQPVVPSHRRCFVPGPTGIKRIGELGHDQVGEPLIGGQSIAGPCQLGCQIGRGDGDASVRVGDVVLELLHPVHGVDRNHHGVGPQNRKVGDDELRAVLQTQQHPIALAYAKTVQCSGHALGLFQHFGIAVNPAQKDQTSLVRVAPSAGEQVVPQARDPGAQAAGQTGRPVGVVYRHRISPTQRLPPCTHTSPCSPASH